MTSFLACTQWQQETQVTCPFSFSHQTWSPNFYSHPEQALKGILHLLREERRRTLRGRSSRKDFSVLHKKCFLGSHLTKQMELIQYAQTTKSDLWCERLCCLPRQDRAALQEPLKTALSWESWHTMISGPMQ